MIISHLSDTENITAPSHIMDTHSSLNGKNILILLGVILNLLVPAFLIRSFTRWLRNRGWQQLAQQEPEKDNDIIDIPQSEVDRGSFMGETSHVVVSLPTSILANRKKHCQSKKIASQIKRNDVSEDGRQELEEPLPMHGRLAIRLKRNLSEDGRQEAQEPLPMHGSLDIRLKPKF